MLDFIDSRPNIRPQTSAKRENERSTSQDDFSSAETVETDDAETFSEKFVRLPTTGKKDITPLPFIDNTGNEAHYNIDVFTSAGLVDGEYPHSFSPINTVRLLSETSQTEAHNSLQHVIVFEAETELEMLTQSAEISDITANAAHDEAVITAQPLQDQTIAAQPSDAQSAYIDTMTRAKTVAKNLDTNVVNKAMEKAASQVVFLAKPSEKSTELELTKDFKQDRFDDTLTTNIDYDIPSSHQKPLVNTPSQLKMAAPIIAPTSQTLSTEFTSVDLGVSNAGGSPSSPVLSSTAPVSGLIAPTTHPAIAAVTQGLLTAKETQQGVTVRLDPPEMGRVYIDFTFDNENRVNVVIRTETFDAEALLRAKSDYFTDLLKDQGLEKVDLSFENSGHQHSASRSNDDDDMSAHGFISDQKIDEVITPLNSQPLRQNMTQRDSLDMRL